MVERNNNYSMLCLMKESQSDMNKVSLAELSFDSSGNYRCEVSTEAPNFETIFKNSNMSVLGTFSQVPN